MLSQFTLSDIQMEPLRTCCACPMMRHWFDHFSSSKPSQARFLITFSAGTCSGLPPHRCSCKEASESPTSPRNELRFRSTHWALFLWPKLDDSLAGPHSLETLLIRGAILLQLSKELSMDLVGSNPGCTTVYGVNNQFTQDSTPIFSLMVLE